MLECPTDLEEGIPAGNGLVEQPVPKGSDEDGGKQAVHAKLPCLFAFPGAGIDTGHQKYDVEG